MKVIEITAKLEEFAPLAHQEEYDNCGLLTGNPEAEVTNILVALDITVAVMREAIEKKCNLIISHHPFIFRGIKKLVQGMPETDIITLAIKNDIAVYAMHTNLDNALFGLNAFVAGKLGITGLQILEPKTGLLSKIVTFCPSDHADIVRNAMFLAGGGTIGEYDCCSFNLSGHGTFRPSDQANPFVGKAGEIHREPETRIELICPVEFETRVIAAMKAAHPYEEVAYDILPLKNVHQGVGAGLIGTLPAPVTEEEFLLRIRQILNVPMLRHTALLGKPLSRVAICTGSGGFMALKAMKSGAGLFITADLKYHDFFGYEGKMVLVDAGHYETEQLVKEWLRKHLNEKFPTFAVYISEVNTNPVHYFN